MTSPLPIRPSIFHGESVLYRFVFPLLLCALPILPLWAQQTDKSSSAKAQRPSVKVGARSTSGPTILLHSDADCTVSFDDSPSQPLLADVTRRFRTTLGEHLITAISLDGKDQWKTVVQIEKPIQKVVLIELLKLRAQRESGEAEAARLQEEIAAKEEQARKTRESRQQLASKQQEMKRRRAEISEKIGSLQIEAQDEESKATKDEAAAEELKQNSYRAASMGGNLNNSVAILSASKANDFYQSAQRRREKAKQLRQQVVHLQAQLQTLGTNEQ